MANLENKGDSFLQALSDFWTRFFADTGDIKALFSGNALLLGQAYLDLLNTVLNTSLKETPLFRKEYYTLLTIREDQVVWREDFKNYDESRWVYSDRSAAYKKVAILHNRVYKPTAGLEVGKDFFVGRKDKFHPEDITAGPLQFVSDPTDPTPDFFASRTVRAPVGGGFVAAGIDWRAEGVKKGDRIWAHETASLLPGNRGELGIKWFDVVQVTEKELRLSVRTPAPVYPVGSQTTTVSWWIERRGPGGTYAHNLPSEALRNVRGEFTPPKNVDMTEVSLWAVDAHVDDRSLARNFGELLGRVDASTEVYRGLLRGLMQLYLYGPTIDRVESALNACAGLPVFSYDGETLREYDPGVSGVWSGANGWFKGGHFYAGTDAVGWTGRDVGGYVEITRADDPRNLGIFRIKEVFGPGEVQLEKDAGAVDQALGVNWEYSRTDLQVVETSAKRYFLDRRVPIRPEIKDPASIDTLTFRAFEPIASAITVTDYINDPEWWHNLPVPGELLPGRTGRQRLASTKLKLNYIGADYDLWVSDPGFYIGANEDGIVSANGLNYRHGAAFVLMDRFLKAHVFYVKLDKSISPAAPLIADLSSVIRDNKPAYTYAFFQPGTSFQEVIRCADGVAANATLGVSDGLAYLDTRLRVGGGWPVGKLWSYAGTYAWEGVNFSDPQPLPAPQLPPLTVGGLDPRTTPSVQAITEYPLSLVVTPP